MQFALFYEIPVPAPWGKDDEHHGVQEHARASGGRGALRVGRAFGRWSTTSCRSTRIARIPRSSTAPSRPAPSAFVLATASGSCPSPTTTPCGRRNRSAVLDLISDGRVDFGTGRSSTRAELEGFGVDPAETRGMWQEAIEHVVGCWTHDEYEFAGKYWQMPKRRVLPKPLQRPAPAHMGSHQLRGRTPASGIVGPGPLFLRRRRVS